jgi:ADP-ribose pyrophosphatase
MEETKEISRERISTGFLKLDKVTYQRGECKFPMEVINRGDSVAGLLFNTSTEKYIFVKQFRPGAGEELIEIIAGTMDVEGEKPEETLRREILEETGFIMTSCELICSSYSSPGGSTEKIYIFNAVTDGNKSGTGGGVEDEDIEIIEFTADEIAKNFDILSRDLKTCLALIHHANC